MAFYSFYQQFPKIGNATEVHGNETERNIIRNKGVCAENNDGTLINVAT